MFELNVFRPELVMYAVLMQYSILSVVAIVYFWNIQRISNLMFTVMTRISALVLLIFCICPSVKAVAGEKLSPGYIVNQAGELIKCTIIDEHWVSDPKSFRYILPGTSDELTGTVGDVKEFGITEGVRYVSAEVDIDISTYRLNAMTVEYNPEWSRERIFLEVLEDGKADLFVCKRDYGVRLFYRIDDGPIQQFIYKKYMAKGRTGVLENRTFETQIRKDFNCPGLESPSPNMMYFGQKEIQKFVNNYNRCQGFGSQQSNNKDSIRLIVRLRPGLGMASGDFTYYDGLTKEIYSFPSAVSFRIGAELEFLLSSRKRNLSILLEPTYRKYSSEDTKQSFVYTTFDIPIGLRKYFPGDHTRFFLNAGILVGIPVGAKVHVPSIYTLNTTGTLDVVPTYSGFLGGGLSVNRVSIECRAYSNRNMTSNYLNWESRFSEISLIVGYVIK
jgi:hypothetical protein